jgi:hypothetical protein
MNRWPTGGHYLTTAVPVTDVDDPELVAEATRGNREAYETLFGRHRDGVGRTAYLLIGDADLAQDGGQEAFLIAWRDCGDSRTPRASERGSPESPSTCAGGGGGRSGSCRARRRPHPAPRRSRTCGPRKQSFVWPCFRRSGLSPAGFGRRGPPVLRRPHGDGDGGGPRYPGWNGEVSAGSNAGLALRRIGNEVTG